MWWNSVIKLRRELHSRTLQPATEISWPSMMKLASLYLISRLFTWACVSHNTGQHAISPLICVEIKLSVQLTKRQRLGIDGKLLDHKINQNKLKEPEPSAYLSFHVFLPFRSTRAQHVYPPTNKHAPVWKIADRFPELSENDLNMKTNLVIKGHNNY